MDGMLRPPPLLLANTLQVVVSITFSNY